jgi:trehalose 6-phosphate phosphatase
MHILSPEGRRALREVLEARGLLAFDFDGTLAPLTPRRDEAALLPGTSRLLATLCAARPCAVITGRPVRDVQARLGVVRPWAVVGNHGLEPGPLLPRASTELRAALPALWRSLEDEPGLELEDKVSTASIHYRRSLRRRPARLRILSAVGQAAPPLRAVPGKLVVNVVPAWAPGKGDALKALTRRHGTHAALYVGDDCTDEDAFRAVGVLGVRVGRQARSAARAFLRARPEVDLLLEALLELSAPR